MSSRNILFFDFSLLLCLLLYFGVGVCAGLPAVDCFPNTTSYNVNSTSGRIYRSNLEFLLSVLASNASTHPNGFYNFSVGSVEPLNYTAVYGLFLCRGDVTTSTCQQCLDSAKTEIFRFCPDRSVATLWYDRCMLRDSNQSIFSRLDTTVKLLLNRRVNATDQAMLVVGSLVHKIAIEAAYNVNKFAVGEANFTSSRRIYALGQCTPDLLISDCQTCFKTAIGHLLSSCGAPKGGRVLTPSCNIRYEAYPFYQISSPPPSTKGNGGTSTLRKIVTKVGFIFVAILLFVGGTCLARRLRNEYHPLIQEDGMIELQTRSLQHDFKDIQAATFNFAIGNKIGQGGFGPVYKGALPDGQEIAVKRLSRSSNQGLEEFKNEIKLVSKLQHRNLVRLLGFCKEGEEMVLIYEFVPNKSLNYYLFEKQALLDWSTRYKIIEGIAIFVIRNINCKPLGAKWDSL